MSSVMLRKLRFRQKKWFSYKKRVYKGLHLGSGVDSYYIPRSDGARGRVNVEDGVKEEKCSLAKYATQSKKPLVKALAESN